MDGHRPHHQRHHRVGGDAQGEEGDERGLGPGVVRRLGARHPFDGSPAEAARIPGQLLLQSVRGERAQHRAVPGEDAEDRAQQGAPRHRPGGPAEVLGRGQEPPDRPVDHVPDLGNVQVSHHLGEPEQPHGQDREVDPVGQGGVAEGHPVRSGLEIRPHRGEEQADQHHGH
jgi:hypothetical protein